MISGLCLLTLAAIRSGIPGSLSLATGGSLFWILSDPRGTPSFPRPTKVGLGCQHWGQSFPPLLTCAMLPLESIMLSSISMGPPIAIVMSTSAKQGIIWSVCAGMSPGCISARGWVISLPLLGCWAQTQVCLCSPPMPCWCGIQDRGGA
jgi:hypothetical protein